MKRIVLVPLAVSLAVGGCNENVSSPSNTPLYALGTGASFTAVFDDADCQNGPGTVNCNIYQFKNDVALNAGPGGEAVQSDGTYFFAVLAPSGQPDPNDGSSGLLSEDAYGNRTFTVLNGVVDYSGTHLVDGDGDIQLMPYSDTPNPGGVYILAICKITEGYPAEPADCKYDAFKVREGGTTEQGNPELSGLKYYDANQNGQYDVGEEGIEGWRIDVTGYGTVTTGVGGIFDIEVSVGQHILTEQQPGNGWSQTGNTVDQTFDFLNSTTLNNFVYTVNAVADGVTTGLNFGNVCNQVTPGGRTLGFWSNKNGQALITAGDRTGLNALNLANATGNQGNFTTNAEIKAWLLGGNATNMAYMLSVQLAAVYLSVQHGFTDGTDVVDYVDTAYDAGFPAPRTVLEEIQYANYLLSLSQYTVSASALRTEQARVKDILDAIVNNESFIAPTLDDALEACGTPFLSN